MATRPRLLIIGASGFIGNHLAHAAADRYQVICGSRANPDCPPIMGADAIKIDITDFTSVRAAFNRARPDVVALLSAISDLDRCEREPELAEAVNVRGVEYVSRECERIGARLLFTSSGAVFDGRKHGYTEEDPTSPISVYGKTKAEAEALVSRILPGSVIARVGLVLGFALRPGTNALLNKLAGNFRAGRPVAMQDYEFRNPIDAGTLVEWMLALAMRAEASGIFNVGSTDSLSRYDMTRRLAQRMGFSQDLVIRESEPAAGRAPRGNDHFLIPNKIGRLCGTTIPNCDQVIERSVHGIA